MCCDAVGETSASDGNEVFFDRFGEGGLTFVFRDHRLWCHGGGSLIVSSGVAGLVGVTR